MNFKSIVGILMLVATTSGIALADGEVIKRGDDFGKSPLVTLADVISTPDKYLNKPVIVEGVVAEVCAKKGCWMELRPEGAQTVVRVTFKDYGFFVPMDSHGMVVRAEGVFQTSEWTKDDVAHLESDGATLVKRPDGSASELGFVASAVELRKPKTKGAATE